MLIRIAERDDLEAITAIYNQAIVAGGRTADTNLFTVEDRLAWFVAHTPDKYPLLLAVDKTEDDEKIIGYLTISPYREGRQAFVNTAEISYYIHFKNHRQGVASYLMEHTLALCPSLKIDTLVAMLLGSNKGSINFLKKYQFNEWGRMPEIAKFRNQAVDHLYFGRSI